MKRRRRIGFTMVELLMSITIVGLLSSIAVPKFREVRRRATATQIMGDFDVMRHATLSFYVDSGYFPKEAGSGSIPKGLVKYLPNKYSFKKKQWTMDYENWTGKTSKAYKATGIVIGISFTVPDTNLGRTAMALVGSAPAFTIGSKYTFLISAFQ
jgi:prepilin-type N-terminal cleavage/methylation domain-containing protein